MPLYEFYCADCRGNFELLATYEKSLGEIACATCSGTNVRRLLSVVARPVRSGGADDFGDYDAAGDDADFGGGCACGGACSCGHND